MGRRRKEDRPRACECCGRQLHRKRYRPSLRLEDRTAFRKRRYCNKSCARLGKPVQRTGSGRNRTPKPWEKPPADLG